MHNWPEIILAIVAVIGLLAGFIVWVYKKGSEQQDLIVATRELTTELKDFKSVVVAELREIKGDILDLKLWRARTEK